jgi:hypothetical protein
MEPKIDLASITIDNEDNHTGGYEYADTITLSGLKYSNTTISSSISASSYPYTITGTGGNAGPYTLGAGTGITSPWSAYTGTPTIRLDGEGADIKINDWSLVDAVKKIEDRLNILHPNTKLEAEWEDLKALGEQYRKLEQHIKDKQATWDKLKAMPPPAID